MKKNRTLSIEGLNFSYHTPKGKLAVLREINATFPSSAITVLLGKSGCGKTTLLNLIAGLLQAESGQVEYRENDVLKEPKIGYVFQTPSLIPWRTVKQNVLLGIELRRKINGEDEIRALRLLAKYSLGGFADAYPATLSGGMQQRVSIIRAVLSGADILLLDEPFSNVDFLLKRELQADLLQVIQEESLIGILVTHDLIETVKIARNVLVLSKSPATILEALHIHPDIDGRLENNMILNEELLGYVRHIDRIMTNISTNGA